MRADYTYPHATDGPRWWCTGRFDPIPVRLVGIGHPSAPRGWEVYRCLDCGEDLVHVARPADEVAKIRALAAETAA